MMRQGVLAAASIAMILWSTSTNVWATERALPAERTGGPIVDAIRSRLADFERAWNRGDLAEVLNQYDPSLSVIAGSEYWDYEKERVAIESLFNQKDRPSYRVEVNEVRELGKDYALANGRYHLYSRDGTETTALFTVVYRKVHGVWRMVYVHS